MLSKYTDTQLKVINRVNEVLSASTMEEKVVVNKTLAILLFKKLDNDNKLDKCDDIKRMGVYTSVIDEVREVLFIDADILKAALVENDCKLFNKNWAEIAKGGDLYPTCYDAKYRDTLIQYVLLVFNQVDKSDLSIVDEA